MLDPASYSRISLCWAIMFVILSVIYRPVEQLLSRTIADRRARGLHGHPLRVPALIQFGFALVFLIVALTMRPEIEQGIFDGSSALYWILVIGVLAYSASYFARGWLAGHERFALYGGLVFLESTSRFLFALAVAVGIGSGQGSVGLGHGGCAVRLAVRDPVRLLASAPSRPARRAGGRRGARGTGPRRDRGSRHRSQPAPRSRLRGRRWSGIMLAEQTLMNAGVLIVAAKAGSQAGLTVGITGFVFNVLLIVRAPLQLFQAIQTSILPHLAGLEARESAAAFHRAIRTTVLVIAAFAGAVAIGLLTIGPFVMTALLGDKGFHYGRFGLAMVGLGMGLHLAAGTFNQAALARGRSAAGRRRLAVGRRAVRGVVAMPTISSEVTRVEVAYFTAALVLCGLLWVIYRRGSAPSRADARA